MRRPAGAGDNQLVAGRLGALGKCEQPGRGAMRRNDVFFIGDSERIKGFGGVAHGIPVRLAAHDDGDRGGHKVNSFRESKSIGRIIGPAQGEAKAWQGVWNGLSCLGEFEQGFPEMPMKKKTGTAAPRTAK